jgi:hypothetical protein
MSSHNRIITPGTDPDRFTEDEAAAFRAGICGWVVEFGNGRGAIQCGEPSLRGASFGNCDEHDAELLVEYWPDGSPRHKYADDVKRDKDYGKRADRAAAAYERAESRRS